MAVFSLGTSLFAQSILTASDFLKDVSDFYATITDYEVYTHINANGTKMSGKASFKHPELLRIDFDDPEEQVIVFDGENLVIYLPGSSAILEQSVENNKNVEPLGLNLLRRYYTVAYESGQDPEPLDEGSDEKVIKLAFFRRSVSEAFSKVMVAIDPQTKLIRRIEATTTQNDVYKFDFTEYNINCGITAQRFIYDPPTSANNYNNFLFAE